MNQILRMQRFNTYTDESGSQIIYENLVSYFRKMKTKALYFNTGNKPYCVSVPSEAIASFRNINKTKMKNYTGFRQFAIIC